MALHFMLFILFFVLKEPFSDIILLVLLYFFCIFVAQIETTN